MDWITHSSPGLGAVTWPCLFTDDVANVLDWPKKARGSCLVADRASGFDDFILPALRLLWR